MDLFLDAKCLITDILAAPDRETWVECNKARTMYSSIALAVVVIIVMVLVFMFAPAGGFRTYTLIGCGFLLLLSGVSVALAGVMSGREWDALEIEHQSLARKNPELANWGKFVEFKRKQQETENMARIAQAQERAARAQQLNAVSYAANTGFNVFRNLGK